MNKYNTLAVIVVCIAFIYVWKVESTPKPPVDRTVTPKSLSGSEVPETPEKPQVIAPLPQVTPTEVTLPSTNTGATTPSIQTGSTLSEPADEVTPEVTNNPPPPPPPPPPSVITGGEVTPNSGTTAPANSETTQSGGISYYNSYLDYGMSLPRGSYYAGYGGQEGAAHTMGFASGTGVTSFESAPIKLWYYPNKLLAELRNGENSFYQDPGMNMTYLKLGNGTIKIEGDMENPIVLEIIKTVNRGD